MRNGHHEYVVRKAFRGFSPAEVADLQAMRAAGYKLRELAAIVDRSISTVSLLVRSAPLRERKAKR